MRFIVFSLLIALEVTVLGGIISNAVPIAKDPFWDTLLTAHYMYGVHPQRTLVLYAVFLMTACFTFAVLLFCSKRLTEAGFQKSFGSLLGVQAIIAVVELYAAFKMIMDHSPSWAKALLYGTLGVSILTKIFWVEVDSYVRKLWPMVQARVFRIRSSGWKLNLLAATAIFLIIYMKDPQAVVAQFYMGDQFHNWDLDCLGPVYAMMNGLKLDMDVYSQYGFGIPVFMTLLMKVWGGFDYVNALKGIMWLGISYYIIWFFILRQWFHSGTLALAAILLGMRAQMFPEIVIPNVWHEPMASVLRFYFDALFFWSLYQHITTKKRIFLLGASLAAGLGIFNMLSTGAGLLFALGGYLFALMLVPQLRRELFAKAQDYVRAFVILAAMPAVIALGVYLTVGDAMWSKTFWVNVAEYHQFFAHQATGNSFVDIFKQKLFLFVSIGLGYVLVYAASLLYSFDQLYRDPKKRRMLLGIALSLYGLCMHAYFIGTAIKYTSFGLPCVFLLFFWLDAYCAHCSPRKGRILRNAGLGISIFFLISTPMFTAYPNVFNLSRNPMVDPNVAIKLSNGGHYFNQMYVDFPDGLKLPANSLGQADEGLRYENSFQSDQELKEFYKKDTDFSQDAALIKRLTSPQERVPLIASFEVLFLSQAKRKPFFYYFPYLSSRPLRMRTFPPSVIFTRPQLAKMISQLEEEKPSYVFMERIFLTPQVPQWYGLKYEDLIELIRHVLKNYQAVENGQYLVALKRIR